MVRKILYVSFAFIYLLGIAGFKLHAHHCGNSLTQISFFTGEDNADPCACEESFDTSCCSDQIIKATNNALSIAPKTLQINHRIDFESLWFIFNNWNEPAIGAYSIGTGSIYLHPTTNPPDIYTLRVLRI